MNLFEKCTTKEKELLKDIGISLENKDYTSEELRSCEISIEEFIMSHSSKNGDIAKYANKYNSILNKIVG